MWDRHPLWVYCVAVTTLAGMSVQFGVKRSSRSVGLVGLLRSSPLQDTKGEALKYVSKKAKNEDEKVEG